MHQIGAAAHYSGAYRVGLSVDAKLAFAKKNRRICSCCFSFHVKTE